MGHARRASLVDLPVEVLLNIISFLPNARSLANLSFVSTAIHVLIEREGWRTFCQSRFPSFGVPGHWKDASHALTTLSRNWDRRAVVARYVNPQLQSTAPTAEGHQARHQTVEFRPVIDSYDRLTGDSWNDRKEVIVYGAGTRLVIGKREQRRIPTGASNDTSSKDLQRSGRSHEVTDTWLQYEHPGTREGTHDITSVCVLKPWHRGVEPKGEDYIVGNSGGDLFSVHQAPDARLSWRSSFETNGQSVMSADLSNAEDPLLAAGLGLQSVALYPTGHEGRTAPLSQITTNATQGRIWSVKYISPEDVAVGVGVQTKPLSVFRTTPTGMSSTPLRQFEIMEDERPTSIYRISALPSVKGVHDGPMFLSASYRGSIRLHDMRSPSQYVAEYSAGDFGPVYSLLALGRERIASGLARHCAVCFHDLRAPGGRAYHYLDPTQLELPSSDRASKSRRWNMFLIPRSLQKMISQNRPFGHQQDWHTRRRMAESVRSGVYSLSSPALFSPTIFAGVAGRVLRIDLASVADSHPDPVFAAQMDPATMSSGPVSRWEEFWNRDGDAIDVSYYESEQDRRWDFREQTTPPWTDGREPGVDERWLSVRHT